MERRERRVGSTRDRQGLGTSEAVASAGVRQVRAVLIEDENIT